MKCMYGFSAFKNRPRIKMIAYSKQLQKIGYMGHLNVLNVEMKLATMSGFREIASKKSPLLHFLPPILYSAYIIWKQTYSSVMKEVTT